MTQKSFDLSQYNQVKVFLIGSTGFIGRWVARRLSQVKAELSLVVRDRNRAKEIFDCYQIEGQTHELDLCDFERLRDIIGHIKPAICFNLAGYGVDPSERDVQTAYKINSDLVLETCEAMAQVRDSDWDGSSIVHVGSALEYGKINGDLSEDSTTNPTTLYGKSKLAATQRLRECCQIHDMLGMTVRLFTVYGPGEHDGRLLPTLLNAAKTDEPLQLTTGEQKRDFTYVVDVAEGLLRLGLSPMDPGTVVNLATGVLTSVRSFVEIAAGILGISDERLIFGAIPTRLEEMEHDPVSIRRLNRSIGWTPPTGIAEGVRQTLRFQKTHYLE